MAVPAMGEKQAAQMRNLHRIARRLGVHIGQAEEDKRHALTRLVLPMSFDRGDFCRLIFKVHEPVLVTDGNLYRRDDEHHPHGHR